MSSDLHLVPGAQPISRVHVGSTPVVDSPKDDRAGSELLHGILLVEQQRPLEVHREPQASSAVFPDAESGRSRAR